MNLGIYLVKSSIKADRVVFSQQFIDSLEKALDGKVTTVDEQSFIKSDLRVAYISTGGSENYFLEMYSKLTDDRPCYLLTSGHSNSLAAAMEILSYMQQHGRKGEIIHGTPEEIANRLAALSKAVSARNTLRKMRFGVVGAPSDWLIASKTDRDALHKKLGAEFVDITMEELLAEVSKHTYPQNKWTDLLKAQGYDSEEMEKSLCIYGALRRLADNYKLGAMTVRCFDLLTAAKTTGCLGLAILNAEGIYAGCEGDVPALVSMAILGEISKKPIFMCNPSEIDTAKGEMILAHCTLPINMPYEMSLTTHFESGIGVAIAGSIAEGDMTIFKASNDLSRYYVAEGTIIENLRQPNLCRSQIRIKLPDYRYFTTNPINNHHLVCTGVQADAVNEFFMSL